MDLLEIFDITKIIIVISCVLLLQAIKAVLNRKFKINKDIWFLIVLLMGFPMGLIYMGMEELLSPFNFWSYLGNSIIFSALSMLLYKTGKFTLNIKEFLSSFKEKESD